MNKACCLSADAEANQVADSRVQHPKGPTVEAAVGRDSFLRGGKDSTQGFMKTTTHTRAHTTPTVSKLQLNTKPQTVFLLSLNTNVSRFVLGREQERADKGQQQRQEMEPSLQV